MEKLSHSALLEYAIKKATALCHDVPIMNSFSLMYILMDIAFDEPIEFSSKDTSINIKNELVDLHFTVTTSLNNLIISLGAFYAQAVTKPKNSEWLSQDRQYLSTQLKCAEAFAKVKGKTELTTAIVFKRIIEHPSDDINELIEAMAPLKSDDDEIIPDIIELEEEDVNLKKEFVNITSGVKELQSKLSRVVVGQDHAIHTFATGYFQSRMRELSQTQTTQPTCFLFAGPPGVGKTFLAQTVAKELALPYKRFDMSEYSDKEANLEFAGTDKVYKSAKAGNVTKFVAENPRCILLFDEIEKAHINVIHLFLQILDAGRVRDNFTDEEVDFSKALIIFTTNAGKQLYSDLQSGSCAALSKKVILKALESDINPVTHEPYFPAAICSRFASGNVTMFNHIEAGSLIDIAKREFAARAEALRATSGITAKIDERVYTALLLAQGGNADARTIRARADSFFNSELYELFRLVETKKSKTHIDDIERIAFDVDLSACDNQITELFSNPSSSNILVFASGRTQELCAQLELVGTVHFASTVEQAQQLLKQHDITFALCDVCCGMAETSTNILNIEDVRSEGRDFLLLASEYHGDLPVYVLQTDAYILNEEEITSLSGMGIREIIDISGKAHTSLCSHAERIATAIYRQHSIVELAKRNKVVSFKTSQSLSRSGKSAVIHLFDFKTSIAVDAEDSGSILTSVSRPDVTFENVIGAADAKKELQFFVDYLKKPRQYTNIGLKAPRGVLLYGPPGTGKTMLAKAMAGESDVTFMSAEGNQFIKSLAGEGAQAVHDIFRKARKYAPTILFIDEIDAIGKIRRGGDNSSTENILTALLAEMDGFASNSSKPVFVLAATNYGVDDSQQMAIDPALLRRFDRRIFIDLPDKDDRILYLRKRMEANSVLQLSDSEIDSIALRSTGMSIAQLESVIELALRSCIRVGENRVTDEIFEDAFETFNSGDAKKWDESQLERTARHEAGHAFVCWHGGEDPTYVTVVARGDHGGYMQHGESKNIYTKEEIYARIRTSLGGRASELVFYGDEDGLSTGASGDLANATRLARLMLCTYGMDKEFGLAVVPGSDADTPELRAAINGILTEQLAQAVRIIESNRSSIEAMAEILKTKNHMQGSEITELFSGMSTRGI